MSARWDVVETLTRLFRATDHHDWAELRAVLAPRVRLDYSAAGGPREELDPDGVVAGWQPLFEALDAHQHLVGNHLVQLEGDAAEATAAFVATHQYAGDTWTLGGDYAFTLEREDAGWQVTAMTMTPVWETGPPDLTARALATAPG